MRGQTFCAAGLPLTCPGAKKLLRIIHRRSEAWQSPLMVTRRDTCHHPPTRVKYIGTTDFNIHLHTPFFEALAFIVFTLALYFDHDSHVMLTLIHVKGFQKRGFTICSCIHICIVFLHHVNYEESPSVEGKRWSMPSDPSPIFTWRLSTLPSSPKPFSSWACGILHHTFLRRRHKDFLFWRE